jgi:hypothetical protein
MLTLKEKLAKNYINARGWKTNQKYLIIESDDWGAIRMPSREVYEEFIKNKIPVDQFSFDKNDSLESVDDLTALFESLSKFQDSSGNPAVLTAFHVVANPNFEAIEANGKKNYVYETILDSYSRSQHTQKSFELIQQGMAKGLYIPQSHGREHIHVKRWMEAINSGSFKENLCFDNKAIIWSKSKMNDVEYQKNYFAGQDYSDEREFQFIEENISDGFKLFEQIFGMKSKTFTPQGGFFGDHILKLLSENDINLIPGKQFHPQSNGTHKLINHYWGRFSSYEQFYYRRNVLFEPGYDQNVDWAEKALKDIEICYRWGKPAVISSHRVNFIGSIFEENRDKSLKQLEKLLTMALLKWPDIKFISSADMNKMINNAIS